MKAGSVFGCFLILSGSIFACLFLWNTRPAAKPEVPAAMEAEDVQEPVPCTLAIDTIITHPGGGVREYAGHGEIEGWKGTIILEGFGEELSDITFGETVTVYGIPSLDDSGVHRLRRQS